MTIELGIFETLAAALVILLLGYGLNDKFPLLKNNNIPAIRFVTRRSLQHRNAKSPVIAKTTFVYYQMIPWV